MSAANQSRGLIMTKLRHTIALLLVFALTGCATTGGNSQSRGMLHGHVSSEQIVPIRVYIHQPGKMHWGVFGLTARVRSDGSFFITDIPPGNYYLGGISDGVTVYALSRLQGPLVTLGPGEVGYLGTQRISGSAMALREGSTLDMEAQPRPEENELLRRLADHFENTEWQRPVLRKLDRNLSREQDTSSGQE